MTSSYHRREEVHPAFKRYMYRKRRHVTRVSLQIRNKRLPNHAQRPMVGATSVTAKKASAPKAVAAYTR